jgi:hypothetical protein
MAYYILAIVASAGPGWKGVERLLFIFLYLS